jgi:growth factor-regulated tyrosine kinase substrate
VGKSSTRLAPPNLWLFPTLVLHKKSEYVMDAIRTSKRKRKRREYSITFLSLFFSLNHDCNLNRDKRHRHSTSLPGHRHKSARELADAELQRAIQLSLEEANGARSGHAPPQPSPSKWAYSEPPIVDRSTYPKHSAAVADEEDDPDLKAAIEASLREASAPKPSAPVVVETPRSEETPHSYTSGFSQSLPPAISQPPPPKVSSYELESLEADAILTFNQTVEQVQAQGGRDLSRYPAVTELYDKASGLRPKLALSLDDAGRKERMYPGIHFTGYTLTSL